MALASPATTSNKVHRIFLRMCVFLRKGRANFLGAPPILACLLQSVGHRRKPRRQGCLRSQEVCPTSRSYFNSFMASQRHMKAPAEKDAKCERRFRVCEWITSRRLGRRSAALWRGSGADMTYATFRMKYGICHMQYGLRTPV